MDTIDTDMQDIIIGRVRAACAEAGYPDAQMKWHTQVEGDGLVTNLIYKESSVPTAVFIKAAKLAYNSVGLDAECSRCGAQCSCGVELVSDAQVVVDEILAMLRQGAL